MRYKHEIPHFLYSIDVDPIKGAIPGVMFCYALRWNLWWHLLPTTVVSKLHFVHNEYKKI